MDFKDYLANTTDNLEKFRAVQPKAAQGFSAMHRGAFFEGDVSVKHKELMALAIAMATHCDDCIGFHMKAAIRAGVTRTEVAETISVAISMGGGPAYMYGAHALEAFDQLAPAVAAE
ncbi:carboxymuconolactone decarboxylase family protein [Maritimibacter dapengensis]|uniref:Carboxymuconolactone decarboxylase family protein n=1 Tax=Maritimibacter dapengensis TaxID=2836868 RepID=A0ABS6T169_9RHOB|nr:carboxymuconolactone decarboxylase family protein [Maritimibacter dapengensis]MBV7378346.1 carboxymuconolactone decarboxylase family protein [Maritimibacter dapengensis]